MAKRKSRRKDRRREQARKREGHWRRVVAEWSKSGLTQTGFCRERRLSLSAFGWWKGELARRDGAKAFGDTCRGRGKGSRSSAAAFLPVRVVGSREDGSVRGQGRIGDGCVGLEVVLVSGRRVRIGSDVDTELLAKVVGVLEGVPW